MEGSAIFEENQSEIKEDYVTYSDMLDADKYVSQFLANFNVGKDLDENEPIVQELQEIQNIDDAWEEELQENSRHQQQPKKRERNFHSFHNFQKHIVTTIRYLIDTSMFAIDSCELKMWNCFMKSTKLNKTLVTILLGDISKYKPLKLAEYGFAQVLEEWSLEELAIAQKQLAAEITEQLLKIQLSEQLLKRRMKNKDQFILYFREFMKELQKGELDKRMIKCTRLVKRINFGKSIAA